MFKNIEREMGTVPETKENFKPETCLWLEPVWPETVSIIEKYQDLVVKKIQEKYPNLSNSEEVETVVMMFINEIYNNAVFHAGFEEDGPKDEEIKNAKDKYRQNPEKYENIMTEISLVMEENRLRLSIRDHGKGFDENSLPDPTTPEFILRDRGRGMFILHKLAQQYGFEKIKTVNEADANPEDHGMTVILEKRIN